MTANAFDEDRERSARQGATFSAVDPELLFQTLAKWLS
jgi:hypothetical protein